MCEIAGIARIRSSVAETALRTARTVLPAPADRPEHLAPHPSQAAGCVWELSVTDFERRAWMTHVLANPGGPDLDAYLAQEYNDDV
ncbi:MULTISPECIES: hypothetical protein [unclassified Nonomuraea]|uniref:hypothetical protein n=1 Tax=unclassified Nonomuraea TaxID=2593643 RepID=UPI00340B7BDE